MSGRAGRDPEDEKRDRIKFPFGHSVDGPLDEVLRSDAGPIRFDSDEGSLLDDDGGDDDDADDDLPLDKTHPESLDEFEDDLSASDPALPAQRPRPAREVVYESGEGPVSWAPRFPGAPVGRAGDDDDDDDEPQPLSPSEVGRIIDVEAEKNPPRQLFEPIPADPSRSGRVRATPSGRAPAAPPRTPFDPPPPAPEVVQRSEVPTQRIDPALVPEPPTFVTGGGPAPRVPGTPSGRHVTPLGPRPPATPSGRQPAAGPRAGDDPATLHTYVPTGSAPPPSGRHVKPLGPRPPATPSGRHAPATPLAGDDPATLHTHVPSAPAPPTPGSRRFAAPAADAASEAPTRVPGRAEARSPWESDDLSVEDAPPIIVPLSASEEDGRQRARPTTTPSTTETVLDLERTHPHSEPELPEGSREESGATASADDLPRGLTSGDELRWPSGSSPTLDALDVGSGLGSGVGASSSPGGGPLLRGVVSDEGDALAGSSMGGGAALPLDDSGSDIESLGRRTAELDIPDVMTSGRRRLFEDSDITTIPSLPELIGSTEGPVSGLLDSQELDGSAVGLPPPGAEGGVSPSLRLVQVSVERVVGLWEGDTAWVLASLGGALIGPILIAVGWEYYSLALDLRPGHPLHAILRPGGSMGLVFGLAGAGLFLLNLTYVLRRRLGVLKKWISLRVWLNAHFICGLTGGSFILAHSALLANNDVARVSSMAIGVAIASGIFGRYVLSHIPRRRDGEGTELSEREHVATRLIELRRQLRTRLGNHPDLRDAALAALATDAVSQVSGTGEDDDAPVTNAKPRGVLYLGPLILSDLAAAARWIGLSMKVRRLLGRTDDPQVKKMLNETLALARVQRLEQRMAQFDAVQDLMDTWRGLHFIVALIVITTMVLHVTIVLRYGRLDWLG